MNTKRSTDEIIESWIKFIVVNALFMAISIFLTRKWSLDSCERIITGLVPFVLALTLPMGAAIFLSIIPKIHNILDELKNEISKSKGIMNKKKYEASLFYIELACKEFKQNIIVQFILVFAYFIVMIAMPSELSLRRIACSVCLTIVLSTFKLTYDIFRGIFNIAEIHRILSKNIDH